MREIVGPAGSMREGAFSRGMPAEDDGVCAELEELLAGDCALADVP